MASDDFVRIIYRPKREVHTPSASKAAAGAGSAKARRNRTSVSIEPDLYHTFVTIVGDAVQARTRIRQWATDADTLRAGPGDNTGVSRLVHKQMLSVIRRVVDAGLTVIRQGGQAAVQQLLEVRIEEADKPARATRSTKTGSKPSTDGDSAGTSDGSANGSAMANAIEGGDSKPAGDVLDDWDSFQGAGVAAAASEVIKKAAGGSKAKKAPSRKGKPAGVDPFAPVAIPVTGESGEDLADAGPGAVAGPAPDLVLGASATDDSVAGRALPPQRDDYSREPVAE
jgi:hypothetical protein